MRGRKEPATKLEIFALCGLPEISAGAPLPELLCRAMQENGLVPEDGDILIVAQKIVSKAEGRVVELHRVEPSPFAVAVAERTGKDARLVEVILRETKRIVRMDGGLILAETHHGFTCANAGVDTSNVPCGWVALLPADPDASARLLQEGLARAARRNIAVIVSDTFGRPWREGLTNVAIGIAGFNPLLDYRGQPDGQGHSLSATVIATADELAAAAELVMGKTSRRPAAIVRHFPWTRAPGRARDLIRPREKDLFR
jgi:coenzyme F420-0:L-glutamate ligase/coenzyme F420-1:gamma-L-glutamate ligase